MYVSDIYLDEKSKIRSNYHTKEHKFQKVTSKLVYNPLANKKLRINEIQEQKNEYQRATDHFTILNQKLLEQIHFLSKLAKVKGSKLIDQRAMDPSRQFMTQQNFYSKVQIL